MNVFILCTGRCGSTTFIKACSHLTNFSAGHETRSSLLGDARLDYPKNHIEADNRLSWLLGRLDRAFGNNAYYVHLTRDTVATASSYVSRKNHGIMRAYGGDGIIMGLDKNTDPFEAALDYCDTVNSNIETFLKDKAYVMKLELERAESQFPRFCSWIGAEGDLQLARQEFSIKHNATIPRCTRSGVVTLLRRTARLMAHR